MVIPRHDAMPKRRVDMCRVAGHHALEDGSSQPHPDDVKIGAKPKSGAKGVATTRAREAKEAREKLIADTAAADKAAQQKADLD